MCSLFAVHVTRRVQLRSGRMDFTEWVGSDNLSAEITFFPFDQCCTSWTVFPSNAGTEGSAFVLLGRVEALCQLGLAMIRAFTKVRATSCVLSVRTLEQTSSNSLDKFPSSRREIPPTVPSSPKVRVVRTEIIW